MCSELFVHYQSEEIVSDKGTSSLQVFVREQLKLNENGEDTFGQLIKATGSFSSAILEKKDDTYCLMLLYYYPKSTNIEEKRIGFLVEIEPISEMLQEVLFEINCQAVMYWNEQIMAKINNSSNEELLDLDKVTLSLGEDRELAGYTISSISAQYLDMTILMAVNNRVLRTDLLREGIKMAFIGLFTFITLSVVLWLYGKYRYRLIKEIKQFALESHPELESLSQESEYEIIRKVLEKDLETLYRKEEDIQNFIQEARNQLTWLIFSSNPPYELNIEELMENYGIPEGGPYYGVLEILADSEEVDKTEALRIEIPGVIMNYNTKIDNSILAILCVSLDSRDKSSFIIWKFAVHVLLKPGLEIFEHYFASV